MTERQLYAAIGEIDEEMVAQAAQSVPHRSLRWLAVAAALAVTAGAVITYFAVKGQKTPPAASVNPSGTTAVVNSTTAATEATTVPTQVTNPSLGPGGLLLLHSNGGLTDTGGMGGDGYIYAYSYEDLVFPQVWETAPETLPVWQMERAYFAGDYTLQVELIRRMAKAMGDPLPEEAEITSFRGSDSPDAIGGRSTWADTDRYGYEVNSDHGYLTLRLHQPLALGKQQNWLKEMQGAFPGLFAGMKTPAIRITGGERHWKMGEDGKALATEPLWTLHIYDAADPDGVCAAFLKGVQADLFEGDALEYLYVYLPEYYEKLDVYPLLTRQQAQQELQSYCSQSGESWQVMGAELIYEGGSLSRLRVPVWRFLLLGDGENGLITKESGLTAFAQRYVAAIPPEYWVGDRDRIW